MGNIFSNKSFMSRYSFGQTDTKESGVSPINLISNNKSTVAKPPKSPQVKRKDGDDASLYGTIKRDIKSKGLIGGILGVVSGAVFREKP
jgi:hypothetical protein